MIKKPPTPSSPITVDILRLSHDGRGVAQHQGKTMFVSGALPGETVQVRVVHRHSQFDEARATAIITASPIRQQPLCAHFGRCGGCSTQHLPHHLALEHKLTTVLEVLARQGGATPTTIKPTLVSQPFGYRRKMRLAIYHDHQRSQIALGFREKNSHKVTPITRCDIMDPWFGHRLTALTEQLNTLEHKRCLTEITLIADENEKAIVFHHRQAFNAQDQAKLASIGNYFAATVCFDPETWQQTRLHYTLPSSGVTLHYTPDQFIQVNALINQQLIDSAIELLAPDAQDTVLDLFCGIGNFSLPIAKQAAEVVGVEGDASATAMANFNAEHNQLQNTAFYTQNLFLPSYQGVWSQRRYAKLIVDPPRAGAKQIVGHITQWQPKLIVYVSCNPFTLARDIKLLATQGYQLRTLQLADMFPQTEHCEVVAQLVR